MRTTRRLAVLLVAMAAAVLLPASPASASVGVSGSLTVPLGTTVGSTGIAGSVTAVNTNTPPNSGESNTLTAIRLAPGCGSAPTVASPCPTPDPGVFQIASPATGAAGTACAGVTFNVSAPDAAGVVTLTPTSPVVLAPPGGAPGSDRCTVNFTFSVLKLPTIDVDPAPGAQTRFNAAVTAQGNVSGLSVTSRPTIVTTVVPPAGKRPPADFDGDRDTDISVFRPGPGYWFVNGGNPSFAVWGTEGDIPVPADYNGDGRADVAVFRPSTGQWFISGGNPSFVAWGTQGDIPVPGDYNGDARDDVAVFRPSTGTWFFFGGDPAPVTFGTSGDIPVPGDYNGDGRTDVAVFRPSTGQWLIRGGSPSVVSWGTTGDVPLPLPYAIRQAFF